MSKYEKVKNYYEKGLWNKMRVKNAVIKGWITEEEYLEITEKEYEKLTENTEDALNEDEEAESMEEITDD